MQRAAALAGDWGVPSLPLSFHAAAGGDLEHAVGQSIRKLHYTTSLVDSELKIKRWAMRNFLNEILFLGDGDII